MSVMLFDRDKIRLDVMIENTSVIPGSLVTGVLIATILRDVEVTAIRLLVTGVERVSFTTRNANNKKVSGKDEYTHYSKLITYFGFSKECGRKGGASLAAGEYRYNISFTLPPGIPPSFFCNTNEGEASLQYTMNAEAIIPNGFDRTKSFPFTVLPTMPARQYEQLAQSLTELPSGIIPLDIPGGCCGYGADLGAAVAVTATVPSVAVILNDPQHVENENGDIVVQNSRVAGGTAEVVVRVALANRCKSTKLHVVRVRLLQSRELHTKGESTKDTKTIAAADYVERVNGFRPRDSATVDVRVRLPGILRLSRNESKAIAIPTLETRFVVVKNIVEVSFPEVEMEAPYAQEFLLSLATTLDHENKVPLLPCVYGAAALEREEKLGAE